MKWCSFILPLLGVFLLACEGEIIDPLKGSKIVRLNAEIEGMKTRATHTSWETGDALGVYMKRSGVPLDASALAHNVKYVYCLLYTSDAADE